MKIGILTIHTAFNYGAMLQAYALQSAIIKLGYDDVQIIDYYSKEEERDNKRRILTLNLASFIKYFYAILNPNFQKKIIRFNKFKTLMNLTDRYYTKSEFYNNPPKFDIYIIGSDQVWNLEQGFSPFWFLDFVKNGRKISYASSFGTATVKNEYSTEIEKYLKTFSAISVREKDGVNIIREAAGLTATHVVDPTFLLSSEDWIKLASKHQYPGDYILAYGFSNSKEFKDLIEFVKTRYNLPVIAIAIGMRFPFKVDKCLVNIGPLEFLALFRDAKVICTDSFHGVAFSINFRKDFFTIPHKTRNSRLQSLLSLLGLQKRQFINQREILDLNKEELCINYQKVVPLLNESIKQSLLFLTENLNMDGKIYPQ